MADTAEKLMTVDEFLVWAEGREGKFELHDGRVVEKNGPTAMSPERIRHADVKGECFVALRDAIKRAKLPCRAYVDGIIVRVRRDRAFVPDALVVCPAPRADFSEIDNPLVVVEVLSPSTSDNDHSLKLEGYLSLPSLAHYLILDPVRRVVIQHAREDGARAATRLYHAGPLRLDPPGFDLEVEALFGPAAD